MVYCGKASQGCQHCRTRRIKCDKKRPKCSQCIRASKDCPGYRDPLSLLFRDESQKVMAKARSQWGLDSETGSPSEPSSAGLSGAVLLGPGRRVAAPNAPTRPSGPYWSASASPSSGSPSSCHSSGSSSTPSPPRPCQSPCADHRNQHPPPVYPREMIPPDRVLAETPPGPLGQTPRPDATTGIPAGVLPNFVDQGLQFYVTRYIIGHADEPKSPGAAASDWLRDPALQTVMSAVGLAGLSNLHHGCPDLALLSRRKYVVALRQTGQLVRRCDPSAMWTVTRAVVLLAMFELVSRAPSGHSNVNTHVQGAAAVMRTLLPRSNSSAAAFRGLIQLCYSTFIPTYTHQELLPAMFFEWLAFCSRVPDPEDSPSAHLATAISSFIQLSATYQRRRLADGTPETSDTIQRLVEIYHQLASWESTLQGKWHYRTDLAPHIDGRAVFDGRYHVYHDIWTARVWNYYRWGMIMVCGQLLDIAETHPRSASALVPKQHRLRYQNTTVRLARDILTSAPSHWRHPLLVSEIVGLENSGDGGSGSAGLPALTCQIRAAACAPGVPLEFWTWGFGTIHCIWSEMGMHQARSMLNAMQSHRDQMLILAAEGRTEVLQARQSIKTSFKW